MTTAPDLPVVPTSSGPLTDAAALPNSGQAAGPADGLPRQERGAAQARQQVLPAEELAAPTTAVRLPRRVVLGAPVDLVDEESWVLALRRWLADGTPGTAIGVNANLVNLSRRDPALSAAIHACDLAYADGQAVVWAGRALGWPVPERLPTTDMVHPLCDMLAETGASVFLFGGEDGVAADAAATLAQRHPGLVVAGYAHGFVPREREDELIALINASGAQVLLVGMGDPIQQMWVARNRSKLRAKVVLTCGGLFNWVNGKQPRPPAWLVSAGMEWAWRLAFEPRRLWKRYVVGNPQFVFALVVALIKGERRPMRKVRAAANETPVGRVRIPRSRPESPAPSLDRAQAQVEKESSWN